MIRSVVKKRKKRKEKKLSGYHIATEHQPMMRSVVGKGKKRKIF